MASPMEVFLFDIQNENSSISEAKKCLELLDLMEICSEGSSSFICDSLNQNITCTGGRISFFASTSDCKNYGGVGMIHFMDYSKWE